MTTIVNTPSSNDSGNGMGMIIGSLILLVSIFLFFVYGLPALRQIQWGTPQVNIPSKIDVNVNQTK